MFSILDLNNNKKNLLFKIQNIYNIWQKIRKENLKELLPIQVLVKEFIMNDE